jgi:histidine triad (HIT) family protein
MDCIFCKISSGEMSTDLIYEDDKVIAFNDIDPKAPRHVLIIPRKHIATLNDATNKETELLGHIITVAAKIADDLGIAESGYRVMFNCNKDGGQAVYHIHLHLLGGRALHWPPG